MVSWDEDVPGDVHKFRASIDGSWRGVEPAGIDIVRLLGLLGEADILFSGSSGCVMDWVLVDCCKMILFVGCEMECRLNYRRR